MSRKVTWSVPGVPGPLGGPGRGATLQEKNHRLTLTAALDPMSSALRGTQEASSPTARHHDVDDTWI